MSRFDPKFLKIEGEREFRYPENFGEILFSQQRIVVVYFEQDKPEELEKDLKALSELPLLPDENIYSYISGATTAKSAWGNLEKSYEDSGLSRKVELLKQLVRLTLVDSETVEDYVSKTTSLKVEKAGLKIDD